MTKQEKIEVSDGYTCIASALAAAQMRMGKALKSSTNPHFKSKYADLSSVVEACLPALNESGIAVVQPTVDDESGRYVKTVLIHGKSGETLECRVPLIVQKNDMQGYGSAVTYARRYGLMSMAGIAPEDDDGNGAAKSPPKTDYVSPDQYIKLRDLAAEAGVAEEIVCQRAGATSLQQFPADKFNATVKGLTSKIEANKPPTLEGDEIPEFNGEQQ